MPGGGCLNSSHGRFFNGGEHTLRIEPSRKEKSRTLSPLQSLTHGRGLAQSATFVESLQMADEKERRSSARPDLNELDEAAKDLRDSPTVENLRRYRDMLKQLLKEIAPLAYRVEEFRTFNTRGNRIYSMLVQTVDRELDELAKEVLANNHDTLAIAAKLDDIRGMILDYFR